MSCAADDGSGFRRLGSSNDTSGVNCRFAENCVPDPDRLEIYVNASPIRIVRGARTLDIGGYCNTANFAGNQLEYQLQGTNTTPWTPVRTQRCTPLGRFQIQVTLPTNYNYDASQKLNVRLMGLDPVGKVYENTRLRSHMKSIDLVTLAQ